MKSQELVKGGIQLKSTPRKLIITESQFRKLIDNVTKRIHNEKKR
jgi:hypothetical protein